MFFLTCAKNPGFKVTRTGRWWAGGRKQFVQPVSWKTVRCRKLMLGRDIS